MFGFHRKKKPESATWIIFNYGDPDLEFAECSECGKEVQNYIGLYECPGCHRRTLDSVRAEVLDQLEGDKADG